MNNVTIFGRIGQEPESRTTATGKTVVTFRVAVERRFKDESGEKVTDWFSVVAWGKAAEFVDNYLGKGRLVGVEGRLQTRKYTTQDGSAREVVEIVAENVSGLDRPRDDHGSPRPTAAPAEEDEYDPFA